jgi:RinA family phage transcriptional activator
MEDKFKKTEYYLYEYKNIDTLNQLSDLKIKQLENDISINAISYEEKSCPTNKFNSNVENEVIRREEHIHNKIEQLKKEKQDRLNLKEIIEQVLNLLTEEERNLLVLRYFSKENNSWTSIAMQLNISIDTCIRIRRNVIKRISPWFN